MKTLKKTFGTLMYSLVFLSAILFLTSGCFAPSATTDPLVGWKVLLSRDETRMGQAVMGDYREYIQKLLTKNRYFVDESNIWFFEDGTGRHAVKIEIPKNGSWFAHVLIYDKENKRIKTIKYRAGTYRS